MALTLSLDVDLMYCLKQATGHNVVSCGKTEMMADAGSSGRVVLVCFNVKIDDSFRSRAIMVQIQVSKGRHSLRASK